MSEDIFPIVNSSITININELSAVTFKVEIDRLLATDAGAQADVVDAFGGCGEAVVLESAAQVNVNDIKVNDLCAST